MYKRQHKSRSFRECTGSRRIYFEAYTALKGPMVGNDWCTPSVLWVESSIDILPSSVPLQMWTLYTARPRLPTHWLAQLDMVEGKGGKEGEGVGLWGLRQRDRTRRINYIAAQRSHAVRPRSEEDTMAWHESMAAPTTHCLGSMRKTLEDVGGTSHGLTKPRNPASRRRNRKEPGLAKRE